LETGSEDGQVMQKLCRSRIADDLLFHRYQAGTYLGFNSICLLDVSPDSPFQIFVGKARGFKCKVTLQFRISKKKAVFTRGQKAVLEDM
jgi:hypothetical protein